MWRDFEVTRDNNNEAVEASNLETTHDNDHLSRGILPSQLWLDSMRAW
jgi:hypothetical protein